MFSLIPELGTEKQLVLCQYGPRPTEMASFLRGDCARALCLSLMDFGERESLETWMYGNLNFVELEGSELLSSMLGFRALEL